MNRGLEGGFAPPYARSALPPAIVHIGVGGFHRAHLAVYIDQLCRSGRADWAILGAGILSSDAEMAEALHAQNSLYHLIVRGAETTDVSIIGSIIGYIFAPDDLEPLVAQIAAPSTQIVSLTITEGGYPVDDATGDFSPNSPGASDHSAFAALAAGLDRRRNTHGTPITVLSCDNILANGHVARTATIGTAEKRSAELAEWIGENVAFPNSMVDRITPATLEADRAWLLEHHGIADRWPVVTEPYLQWVVEDSFAAERLPLEELDVIITDNVEPYEQMKLRLLNAGHSCIAYLAALEGIDTVDIAMAAPHLRSYLEYFLRVEAQPLVDHVPGINLDDYVTSLVERFSNPNIGDQISRLCLDGSAKFPKFLVPTIEAALAADAPLKASALALAGWCQYLCGTDEAGLPITHSADPNLEEAVAHAAASQADPAAFLEFATVFPPALRLNERFRAAFVESLEGIRRSGVSSATAEMTSLND